MLLKGMEFDTTHFITDVSGKYPQLWALKGAHPVTVNKWYKFGVLASIRTIAPGFREISELPDWVDKNSKAVGPATKKSEALKFGDMRKSSWPYEENKAPCTYLATNCTNLRTDERISRKRKRRTACTPPLYKKLRTQKKDHRNSENRKTSEHQKSFTFFFSTAFGPLFSYSIVREPEKYLRLKVENELRLC
ncbi:hypothetical protein ACS0TY_016363 [Phlomoides rotata]